MEIKRKICIVVKAFLEHPTYTMEKLANLPEIKEIKASAKDIQTYLTDPMIINLFDIWTYNTIQNKLNENKQKEIDVDSDQEMTTSQRLSGNHKAFSIKKITPQEKKKMDHIYTFTKIHLRYPKISCDRIAMIYNQNNVIGETVTSDYVSECLMSKTSSNFFADNIWRYSPVNLLDNQQAGKLERTNSRLN